jgi:hypothetical protein
MSKSDSAVHPTFLSSETFGWIKGDDNYQMPTANRWKQCWSRKACMAHSRLV